MHRHIHRCSHAVFAVVAIMVIGSLLLSACGRVVQGAVPDTAVPSMASTALIPGIAPTNTPSPMPPPTATPLPPGTVVNINGVIEHISINNNITIIVVNQITYVLPHNFVLLLGKRLRIGVPIVFDGKVDTAGQIIIINVVQINNQVIVINPPRHHSEDDDHEGGDEDD